MATSIRTTLASGIAIAAIVGLAPTAGAQNLEKLSLHGYLTQGYARSDSALVEGAPKSGTSDYRRAALMMRYASTDHDNFVLQIAHRRLGDSPSMAYESDVKVDWAFFEHNFAGTSTRLRVGKAPIPMGIYNETRYVGTQLPFYRAPYAMYHEGIWTSESVDGLTLTQPLFSSTPFGMEASAYAGSFSYLDFVTARTGPTTFAYLGQRAKANNVLGGQLWVSTPIDGLRIGGGGSRYTVANAFFQPGKYSFDGWTGGIDGKFERFFTRSEFRRINAHKIMSYNSWYTQGGVSVTSKLSINGQAERANYHVDGKTNPGYKVAMVHDDAAGVNYAFSPSLILKIEGHQTKGYNIESVVVPQLTAPLEGKYFISSLSVTF